MNKLQYKFSGKTTTYYLDADFSYLGKLVEQDHTVLITDEHLFSKHQKRFGGWNTIVINAGEQFKVQETVDSIIAQLIELGADRKTTLVGIGGGVVTDITGYVAAIYMRGLPVGYVPTSILAMVDASIGGKNGIDVGVYKNMVGTIRQPQFLLYIPQELQCASSSLDQGWVLARYQQEVEEEEEEDSLAVWTCFYLEEKTLCFCFS